MRKKVLVLGGNFAGLNAAIHIKDALEGDVDVTVVSASSRFLFNPSLIWLPFGKRKAKDITFRLEPTFDKEDVNFIHAEATAIDPGAKKVTHTKGKESYDYLVIATGYKNNFDIVPGFENTTTITTLEDAIAARKAWKKFLEKPGPIVIGATQSAGCFGAAYEYLFNVSHQLKKNKIKKDVPLTYVSSEPCLGDFGIGGMPGGEKLLGMFLKKEKIGYLINESIEYIDTDHVKLGDGKELPFAYSMIVPPFVGQEVVKNTPGLSDDKGYIPVHDTYQSKAYPDIYAAGIAAQVVAPWTTPTPVGVPKTGFPTEVMAKVAAKNIVSAIRGEPQLAEKNFADMPAICVMDAGNNGVLILGDKMLAKKKKGVMIPGPQNHAMKLAFEKYFLWKMRTGRVELP